MRKNTVEKSVQTSHKEVVIEDTILPGFNLRPVPFVVERFTKIYDTITLTDPVTGAQLSLWKNKYQELEALCQQQPKALPRIRQSEKNTSTSQKVKIKTVVKYRYNWLTWLPWGVIALGLAWALVRNRFFKYLNRG